MSEVDLTSATDPDPPERRLTATEQRYREHYGVSLTAWSRYLSKAPRARTLADADTGHLPLLRTQIGDEIMIFGGWNAYLNPRHAWQWLTDSEHTDGVKMSLVTVVTLAEALAWMGGRITRTMTPVGEPHRRSPYRDRPDWFRVSAEVYARIAAGNFTPTLAELPGRRSSAAADTTPAAVAARRAILAGTPERMLGLVRAVLTDREPTVFQHRARAEGRPLVPRRGGRPRRSGYDNFDHRFALVPMEAIVSVSDAQAMLTGTPALDLEGARLTAQHAADRHPDRLEMVRRVRDVATGMQVSQSQGWVRASLAEFGCRPWSDDALIAELATWRLTNEQDG